MSRSALALSKMIDSHAHLDSSRYDADRDALLARAWEAGVRAILSIGIGEGPDTMHGALDLARGYAGRTGIPAIYASAGVHPHEARFVDNAALAKLDGLLDQPEVLACGEIGLDYYYDHSPREVQQSVFTRQMEIAASHRKPIIIHCRPSDNSTNAWDDTLNMLESPVGSDWARGDPPLFHRRVGACTTGHRYRLHDLICRQYHFSQGTGHPRCSRPGSD